MKTTTVLALLSLALYCAATAASVVAAAGYHVIDLGSLGGDYSVGLDINNSGQVTGYSTLPSGATHAFLYSGGVMTDLGTLGGTESYGRSINDAGQVTGDSLLSGSAITATDFSHAFLYSAGVMTDLGTLGGNRSSGYGINDTGQITGGSFLADNASTRAFLYSGGSMSSLGLSGTGRSINAVGQVVAGADLWTPNTPNGTGGSTTPLGSLGGGGTQAYGINDSGQVTGYSLHTGGETHAFLYTGGSMIDLGVGRGTAINTNGQVVGGEHSGDPTFLYSDGARTDLNTLIDPDSGWLLETANSINDSGWITGRGSIGGVGHAFILTPIPEPSPGDASFSSITDLDVLDIDFGAVPLDSPVPSVPFSITNLAEPDGTGLSLDALVVTGDSHILDTDAHSVAEISPGETIDFAAWMETSTAGNFSATTLLDFLDTEGREQQLTLNLVGEVLHPLEAGDANQDYVFDQFDLVDIFPANKYMTGRPATWGEGDWNGAPGGSPGNPPPGDGVFDNLDIVAALQAGTYLTGPYAGRSSDGDALAAVPEPSAVVLIAMGLAGLLTVGRRRRRQ